MDRVKESLSRIMLQLRVLTVSQRLVVVLCAALVVTSVLWLMNWSATPQRVPVLEQDFDFAMLGTAETALRANGIEFETAGQRILVRAEDQDNAIRVLHESNAVPQDGRIDLDALIKDTNPFVPESERIFARTVAKGNKLAQIIKKSPQVLDAEVVLNPEQKRRIGAPSDVPTASVIVTLAPNAEMSASMVQGFANLVSRAVAGLTPHMVSIIDGRTFQHYSVPSPQDAVVAGHLDEVKKHESHLLAKVMETLRYVPNVLASVTVELDNARVTKETQKYDKPEIKTEESTEDTSTAPESSGEEGVYANVGAGISGGSSGGNTSATTQNTAFFDPKLTEMTKTEQIAPSRKRVTASVHIPRSWIAGVFRLANPDKDKPTEADLQPSMTAERDRIKSSVAKTIMADPKDVEVDVYPDMDINGAPIAAMTAGVPAALGLAPGATGPGWKGYLDTYGPQAGLAFLALMSLMMLGRTARRSAVLAEEQRKQDVRKEVERMEDLIAEETAEVLGTAEFSDDALEGKEISPDLLRNRNLVSQVSRMVEKDPHGSAELLRKWVQDQT